MMKKIITSVLAALMLISVSAHAAPWVTVSSWAYTDVSNFKKEGLLPESFEDISDYTQYITRAQFAELLYCVLKKAHYADETLPVWREFLDTENEAARYLGFIGIMEGESAGTRMENGMLYEHYNFFPDRILDREEMAAVVYRAMSRYCSYMNSGDTHYNLPSDYYGISKWAREAVCALGSAGVISGMEDGSFAPKMSLTIEQAVCVTYHLYNLFPTADAADGANIYSAMEQTLQRYANDLTETKKGNVLYIKDGDNTLMEFETDIYTKLYSVTSGGTDYAIAQNSYGRCDVYDLRTRERAFLIPHSFSQADEYFIVTKSAPSGACTFGLYDYNGNEILKPEYSMSEIEEIKAYNASRDGAWDTPQDASMEPEGYIYYTDADDHLHRIDSNGENDQKLSDTSCVSFQYINGVIYFTKDHDGGLYCVNSDGTNERLITEKRTGSILGGYSEYLVGDDGIGFDAYYVDDNGEDESDDYLSNSSHTYFSGEWVYYKEYDENNKGSVWRVSVSGGGVNKECVSQGLNVDECAVKDGDLYLICDRKYTGRNETRDISGNLYRVSGGVLTKLTERDVVLFGFMGDSLVIEEGTDYDDTVIYLADKDGTNERRAKELEKAREKEGERDYSSEPSSAEFVQAHLSDDKYTVSLVRRTSVTENGRSYEYEVWTTDSKGVRRCVQEYDSTPDFRIGDTLYSITDDKLDGEQISGNLNEMPVMSRGPEKRQYVIYAYNMNTGSGSVIARGAMDIDPNINPRGADWFTYTDYSFNTHRVSVSDGSDTIVFPSKGIHRYGKILFVAYSDGCMYKIDTDGNYALMTDNCQPNFLYVKNGALYGRYFRYWPM